MSRAKPLRPARSKRGKSTREARSHKRFPIVGIGASAGGFEAFVALLKALPVNTGMGFVLAQHLDPKHESRLTNLLSTVTRMPVRDAKHGSLVEPNCIYVMPPNTRMTIVRGKLMLTPRAEHVLPIDFFFQSLAEDAGNIAVGVILSGLGTDGTLGLKAIKAAGGVTIAEETARAKYAGMPGSAIAGGFVDHILPPEEIGRKLAEFANRTSKQRLSAAAIKPPKAAPNDLVTIFGLLHSKTGVDFSHYKASTIERVIERRAALKKIGDRAGYVKFLEQQPEEVEALFQALLILVTRFFRDAKVFEALKKSIFPRMLENKPPDAPLRIWVAGCSTGEEVYSIAICLAEFLQQRALQRTVKIYATDISDRALAKARTGLYPKSVNRHVSAARLKRFFVRENGGWQVVKSIRDWCVFARHDVTVDPPFANMDLVSCRNLLIYFDAFLQKIAVSTFHYALNAGGFLVLGASEGIGSHVDLFSAVDQKRKIYAKKVVPRSLKSFFAQAAFRGRPSVASATPPMLAESDLDIRKHGDRVLVSKFCPSGVIIDSNARVLQFRGRTSEYLEHAAGEASLNLFKMVHPDLLGDVRAAVRQALKSRASVKNEEVAFHRNGRNRKVAIEVVPFEAPPAGEPFFHVLFHEIPASGHESKTAAATRHAKTAGTVRLQEELVATRETLESIIEEREETNEELQAASEELQTTNEELQSTNEELETAKEELESSNEELTTLNEELTSRNAELAVLNSDLNNLLTSVNFPILMLGKDLRIRRFTSSAEKLFELTASAIGQRLSEVELNFELPGLAKKLAAVIETPGSTEEEIQSRDHRWYSLRIRPYRTADGKLDGAVMALVDIDRMKQASEEIRYLEEALLAISDREQQRVGHDLHDGICQQLAGIQFVSELVAQKLPSGSETKAEVSKIAAGIRQAILDTRQLARGLSPVAIESDGLMAALDELASNSERLFHVACRFECLQPILITDKAVATHLYRIAQEAIRNAVVHGRAKHVAITMATADGNTHLTIADDGTGFAPDSNRSGGMGLRIMNYRAEMIGGRLSVGPANGKGTRVVCTFKL
jgi:two-component system, chemotaxis family, CheB/CheR fusion protein